MAKSREEAVIAEAQAPAVPNLSVTKQEEKQQIAAVRVPPPLPTQKKDEKQQAPVVRIAPPLPNRAEEAKSVSQPDPDAVYLAKVDNEILKRLLTGHNFSRPREEKILGEEFSIEGRIKALNAAIREFNHTNYNEIAERITAILKSLDIDLNGSDILDQVFHKQMQTLEVFNARINELTFDVKLPEQNSTTLNNLANAIHNTHADNADEKDAMVLSEKAKALLLNKVIDKAIEAKLPLDTRAKLLQDMSLFYFRDTLHSKIISAFSPEDFTALNSELENGLNAFNVKYNEFTSELSRLTALVSSLSVNSDLDAAGQLQADCAIQHELVNREYAALTQKATNLATLFLMLNKIDSKSKFPPQYKHLYDNIKRRTSELDAKEAEMEGLASSISKLEQAKEEKAKKLKGELFARRETKVTPSEVNIEVKTEAKQEEKKVEAEIEQLPAAELAEKTRQEKDFESFSKLIAEQLAKITKCVTDFEQGVSANVAADELQDKYDAASFSIEELQGTIEQGNIFVRACDSYVNDLDLVGVAGIKKQVALARDRLVLFLAKVEKQKNALAEQIEVGYTENRCTAPGIAAKNMPLERIQIDEVKAEEKVAKSGHGEVQKAHLLDADGKPTGPLLFLKSLPEGWDADKFAKLCQLEAAFGDIYALTLGKHVSRGRAVYDANHKVTNFYSEGIKGFVEFSKLRTLKQDLQKAEQELKNDPDNQEKQQRLIKLQKIYKTHGKWLTASGEIDFAKLVAHGFPDVLVAMLWNEEDDGHAGNLGIDEDGNVVKIDHDLSEVAAIDASLTRHRWHAPRVKEHWVVTSRDIRRYPALLDAKPWYHPGRSPTGFFTNPHTRYSQEEIQAVSNLRFDPEFNKRKYYGFLKQLVLDPVTFGETFDDHVQLVDKRLRNNYLRNKQNRRRKFLFKLTKIPEFQDAMLNNPGFKDELLRELESNFTALSVGRFAKHQAAILENYTAIVAECKKEQPQTQEHQASLIAELAKTTAGRAVAAYIASHQGLYFNPETTVEQIQGLSEALIAVPSTNRLAAILDDELGIPMFRSKNESEDAVQQIKQNIFHALIKDQELSELLKTTRLKKTGLLTLFTRTQGLIQELNTQVAEFRAERSDERLQKIVTTLESLSVTEPLLSKISTKLAQGKFEDVSAREAKVRRDENKTAAVIGTSVAVVASAVGSPLFGIPIGALAALATKTVQRYTREKPVQKAEETAEATEEVEEKEPRIRAIRSR